MKHVLKTDCQLTVDLTVEERLNFSRSPIILRFAFSQPLTLGAELELQILNRESLELSSSSPSILERLSHSDSVKAEIYQSMIEITTGICRDANQVHRELKSTLSELISVCDDLGLCLASAGTHPLAVYRDHIVFPDPRYQEVLKNHKWIAKRLLIFGLHVHIGMRDGEHAIKMSNALLRYLPLFLALSASSPFCRGDDTHLSSSRITFFESLPTAGHPYTFDDWSDFKTTYSRLIQSGSIRSPKDLWWDIRPSPGFGTIEIRICDSPATVRETSAIVALVHLLAQKLDAELAHGKVIDPPPDWIMRENKWRVARNGVRTEIIVTEDGNTKRVQDVLSELLLEIDELVEMNGYQEHMNLLRKIASFGASADRQRELYKSTRDFEVVLESLVEELKSDHPDWGNDLENGNKRNSKKGGNKCA